jgi:hypothetical protein
MDRDLDDTSGNIFQVTVSWRSKKYTSVALSTADAEYVALASAAQEAVWMRSLISEQDSKKSKTIKQPFNSGDEKFQIPWMYKGIKFHFIQELVSDGIVKLQYCLTQDMIDVDQWSSSRSVQQTT